MLLCNKDLTTNTVNGHDLNSNSNKTCKKAFFFLTFGRILNMIRVSDDNKLFLFILLGEKYHCDYTRECCCYYYLRFIPK